MDEALIVFIVIGLPVVMGVVATMVNQYYKHQRHLAELQATHGSGASSKEVEKLASRIAALETHCAKLQDQVNLAHDQLADERRVLDAKLNAMLPDMPQAENREAAARPNRQRTI